VSRCLGYWGDFNVIRSRREKLGISFDFRNMFAFNDWIDFFDLLDYQGMNRFLIDFSLMRIEK
jgi:hypothetical protein